MEEKKIFVVVPAYNEEETIGIVINNLREKGLKNIIVVNDGSSDRTEETARNMGVEVYSHVINTGLGGALDTGISAALLKGADIIVTCDADGQHDAEDVKRVAESIAKNNADVIIGSRIRSEGMPIIRKIGNYGLNFITYLLFGIYVADTQSGLRAFSKKAAEKIEIKMSGMEVSSEIIKEIGRHKLEVKEVPIKAIYTDYSFKKGQKNLNAFRIIYKLIMGKFIK